MKRLILGLVFIVLICHLSFANTKEIGIQQKDAGIILKNIDNSMSPQDDFYRYANGIWLKNVNIPSDKSSWGVFYELREGTLAKLHKIVMQMVKNLNSSSSSKKIADLYISYMDQSRLNKLGIKPLLPIFTKIDQIESKNQIANLMAQLSKIGVSGFFDFAIHQDAKDSSVMVADLVQTGLGLPDRDYYIQTADKNLMKFKGEYLQFVQKMLVMLNDKNALEDAKSIVNLETRLAYIQWSNVENRDPVKTYNRIQSNELSSLINNFSWDVYLSATGINKKVNYVIVSQPSYLKELTKIINDTPLATWKVYFKWRVLGSYSGYLSDNYADAFFDFYGKTLRGVPNNSVRWKRGVGLVEGIMGDALGKAYVRDYFPPENKEKMQHIVANLIVAYRNSIESLDWMSSGTKSRAQAKLDSMMLKIGYPNKWRDYSNLIIKHNDLLGNVIRSNQFEYLYSLNKLGNPVDRTEWAMTPQTINAYYNPELNEIVFPAAILQPPFFNANADDAANYGGIGAVIGHEISHAFDDQGSQYDAKGNLNNWWTKEDRDKFRAKTKQLVEQYNSYSPIAGYYVNGELTLGENIADNSGLAIAYKAYKLSLNSNLPVFIDNFNGDQRFYLGWAQVWCGKMRNSAQIMSLKTDPHSPSEFRANGALVNQPAFYKAFGVKPNHKMYVEPNKRVIIW